MLRNYFIIAMKVLMRRKFFTFISLFGISFTLLVLMVVTSFLDHIFGPHTPENKLDRTLGVYTVRMVSPEGTRFTSGAGYKFLNNYVRTLPSAEKVSIHSEMSQIDTYKAGEAIQLYLKYTDGEFWEIMEFNFLEGRPISREDEQQANFVAVINQATRDRLFNAESAVGKTIPVNGKNFQVIGVVENVSILRFTPFADVWVPISTQPSPSYKENLSGNFIATILAKDKEDIPLIRSDFDANLAKVELPDPRKINKFIAGVDTFFESISRQFLSKSYEENHADKLAALLLFFMILFMILPTINLVNINISRIIERSSEIGVRKAFGASSWALVGQFVIENVLLTLIGGLIGFLLSYMVLEYINATGWIRYANLHLNWRIFAYGLATIIFFGLFSGVYPAWKMSKLHPVDALNGGIK